ncbi:MAG: hypothetical protein ACOYOP_08310, partial [Microthrixaceae bacterium]
GSNPVARSNDPRRVRGSPSRVAVDARLSGVVWSVDDIETTDRWLRRRGLPHLIPGYSTAEDALTRAAPVLVLVFLAEVLGAFSENRRGWREFWVFLAASAVLLGAAVAVNLLRSRRPLSLPDRVGVPELAVFVLVPPLLPLLFDGLNWHRAGYLLVQGIVVLVLTVVVVDYALIPMGVWAVAESARTIRLVAQLAARTLPTLLLLVTFIFLNAEMWQVGVDFTGIRYLLTLALLVLVGSAFVLSGILGTTYRSTVHFDDWDQVDAACREAGCRTDGIRPADPPDDDLRFRARVNVVLVLFMSQALQILAVAVAVFLFYVVFGLLTVPESTVVAWVSSKPEYLVEYFPAWLREVPVISDIGEAVTLELLRVAGFIGAFAGLQVAIVSTTDGSYRREFLGRISSEVREAVAVSLRSRLVAAARA